MQKLISKYVPVVFLTILFSCSSYQVQAENAFFDKVTASVATTSTPAPTQTPVKQKQEKSVMVIHLQDPEDLKQLAVALQLNQTQTEILMDIVREQIPHIVDNVHALELAHGILLSMANNKTYDDFVANSAIDQIAKSSASLALMQAEREFKFYTMLSKEQAKKLDSLQSSNIIQLM